jgi:hypothetical protein
MRVTGPGRAGSPRFLRPSQGGPMGARAALPAARHLTSGPRPGGFSSSGTAEKYRNRDGSQQTSADFDGRAASLGPRVFERRFDVSSRWHAEGHGSNPHSSTRFLYFCSVTSAKPRPSPPLASLRPRLSSTASSESGIGDAGGGNLGHVARRIEFSVTGLAGHENAGVEEGTEHPGQLWALRWRLGLSNGIAPVSRPRSRRALRKSRISAVSSPGR